MVYKPRRLRIIHTQSECVPPVDAIADATRTRCQANMEFGVMRSSSELSYDASINPSSLSEIK
jgi:hypothetical protein